MSLEQQPTQRILAVDDSPAMVGLVTSVIAELGYIVEGHINPVYALNSFRNNPREFGLVVTDRDMPFMDGLRLIESIEKIRKEQDIEGSLPFIMLSGGQFTPEAIAELKKYGVKLLKKPLSEIEVLEDAVKAALKRDLE